MSYKWEKASTPQGRERLKELLDSGIKLVCRSIDGMHDDECYFIEPDYDIDEDDSLDCLEFLDPEPQAEQPDENGLLRCPFCGGKAVIIYDHITAWEIMINVGCNDCQLGFSYLSNVNEKESDTSIPKGIWNRRAGREAKNA